MKLLLLLVLLPALGGSPSEDVIVGTPSVELASPAVVRTLRGRVSLFHGKRLEHLTRALGSREVHGLGLVELGPTAAAEVSWRGWGSLGLRGRSSAAFEVLERDQSDPCVRIELRHVHRAEVEARRVDLVVDLPGGRVLELRSAAVEVRQDTFGVVELLHRGGTPVRVLDSPKEFPRRAQLLTSGQRLRLPVQAAER